MKRFVYNLLLFCLLPLPVLYGLQMIVDSGLKKSNHGLYAAWNDIYDGTINADLLIMGSSRAELQISPTILDENLKINTYNLGISAWTFPMQNARFNIYLKYNAKPRYVVHSLDLQMFSRREDLFNYQQFLPYLNDRDIKSAAKGYKGEFTRAQYYFPMFKYNGNMDLAAAGFLEFFNLAESRRISVKGYREQDLEWDGSFETFKKKFPDGYTHAFDSKVAEEFDAYLKYCKENDIKVILVFSPEYIELQPLIVNRKEIMSVFESLSKKHDVPFLDYSSHPIAFNKTYFYNSEHLTKGGAELFSEVLAQDLRKLGVR